MNNTFQKMVAAAAREIQQRGELVDLAVIKNTVKLMILDRIRTDAITNFDAGIIPGDLAERILLKVEEVEKRELAARLELMCRPKSYSRPRRDHRPIKNEKAS